MRNLEFKDGSLYVYEDERLIIKTRGNPQTSEPFLSEEEAFSWYSLTIQEQEIQTEEVLNEENN